MRSSKKWTRVDWSVTGGRSFLFDEVFRLRKAASPRGEHVTAIASITRVITCPEGGSVTCSILRIVDELGRSPDNFQWWASIWIPAAAAVAAVAVLLLSVWTANSARRQAKASEAARVAEASHRIEDDRKRRFISRIADIFETLPDVLRDVQMSVAPATVPLIVRISAAALEADPAELALLKRFRSLALLSEKDPGLQASILSAGSDLLVEWIHASPPNRMKLFALMKELDAAESEEEVTRLLKHGWSLNKAETGSDAATPPAGEDPRLSRRIMRWFRGRSPRW